MNLEPSLRGVAVAIVLVVAAAVVLAAVVVALVAAAGTGAGAVTLAAGGAGQGLRSAVGRGLPSTAGRGLQSDTGQGPPSAVGRGSLSAAEIVERYYRAFYYQGDDMIARVTMELIDADGGTRTRVMSMVRRDEADGGDQKYFIYFHEPGDVRRVTFMVWKYPGREDDRWIFVPAVDLVRRIAADDKRSSFVGSDFTYEDVSGRDVGAGGHRLLRQEELDGRLCYVVESLPREEVEYVERVSWIDVETYLPIREEYTDAQGEVYRVFTADRIETIPAADGNGATVYPTVVERTMTNRKTGHRTRVVFDEVAYDVGVDEDDFSERSLRRPPRRWIR